MPKQSEPNSPDSSKTKPPLIMEIAGMAIGAVSLLSMFENAITCFTRVRMVKTFGSDLLLFMIRLEVLDLRLTRWGEAAGLNERSKDNKPRITNLRTSDQALANKVLKQIETRFEDAVKALQDIDIGEDIAASTADLGDKGIWLRGPRHDDQFLLIPRSL